MYPLNGWDLQNCHTIDLVNNEPQLPEKDFYLHPIYPNPFNPLATVKFDLVHSGILDISIYNILGNVIVSDQMQMNAGTHQFQWNASNSPSGIYFIRLGYGTDFRMEKALLVK